MKEPTNLRVVIVEDDYLSMLIISQILEKLKYEAVGKAADGQKGVDLVRELRPDIVLMDIRMPKMDGIKASEIITRETPTPIVILTAYDTEAELEHAREAGVAAYLIKPLDLASVQRAILIAISRHNDLMDLRRLNKELEEQKKALGSALTEIKQLSGLLPICSHCNKIRDEHGHWNQLESYISSRSEAEFSHGVCPVCAEKYYPDVEYNPNR